MGIGESVPEVFQQEAVQQQIMPIMAKKVWHVNEVPSLFVSVHVRNHVVN